MSKIDIVKAALFTPGPGGRWGLPVLLWGDPGVGKTFQIRQLASTYFDDFEELTPGARGEGAFGVVPVPGGGYLSYPMPDWAYRISGKSAVVFVDEITTAPPAVQPALLGLLQFGVIGSKVLGNRVRIIGAANPPEIAAAGYELPCTVSNRCGHLQWTRPDVGAWTAYMLQAATADAPTVASELEEQRVLEAWSSAYASAVGAYSGFLHRMPEFLHKMPKIDDPQLARAWPSPRTNELAVRALASADVHRLTDADRDEFAGAFVGDACAIAFATWSREADLPLPEALLTGTAEFRPETRRFDRTVAVLNSCTAYLFDQTLKMRADMVKVLWAIMLEICESGNPDLTVPTARTLCNPASKMPDPRKIPAGERVISKLAGLLRLSGELP